MKKSIQSDWFLKKHGCEWVSGLCNFCACRLSTPRPKGLKRFCGKGHRSRFNQAMASIALSKRQKKPKQVLKKIDLWSDANKARWQKLRYETFLRFGRKCLVCGASDRLHIDHIKPKSLHPELAFDPSNLQVLCEDCNYGKGYKDETDWRESGK